MYTIKHSLQNVRRTTNSLFELLLLAPILLFVLVQNYYKIWTQDNKPKPTEKPLTDAAAIAYQQLSNTLADTYLFVKRMNLRFMHDLADNGTPRDFELWLVYIESQQNILAEHAKQSIAASIGKYKMQNIISIVQDLLKVLDMKKQCLQTMQSRKFINDQKAMYSDQRAQLGDSLRDKILQESLYLYSFQLATQGCAYLEQEKELHRTVKGRLNKIKTAVQEKLKCA